MEGQSELVERVVRMQLTSPDFAEYCVAHVTDPKHRFLFSRNEDEAERRLYVRLLEGRGHQKRAETPAVVAPASAPGRTSSLMTHGGTAVLWMSLLDYFSSTPGVRGPHMPHMFRTEADLAAFVDILDGAQREHVSLEDVVQFMLRRLPMTEVFLYVLCYMCDVRVHEVRRETRRRSSGACVTDSADGASDDKTLQAAGTLLFIANMLLLQHDALERPLRYLSVFEFYMQRMVEALAGTVPKNSPVATFLRETVMVWSEGHVFGEEALDCMKRAIGCSLG
ncbi:hypothetical protein C3747_78g127 [Trypanosoma cruzi]|uniref:Uncharacterized protein n=2 Tax=Trypanosoma cruzi TaxID=5693 RepID=Q4E5S4_TRYCC|nr:hypothetical protein, conserved [Trypanosoma cruzi]EAO00072.1 hypothetical protein, conserved [Trypanosoma cruzi]KAF5224538.1 Kinetochore interacting protein 6 [Trypanosoma cruzi]PWV09537.1 hypothetical protein C3747_78g127 [Trypanosoma cruzi]RNC50687.1 hypothetical protein TcCL_ESM12259 [Trypanosoma cruzi]|eukprot:XP_821923.1 hypothetical protein [Trypanosoma cruzi strain CL Brener]